VQPSRSLLDVHLDSAERVDNARDQTCNDHHDGLQFRQEQHSDSRQFRHPRLTFLKRPGVIYYHDTRQRSNGRARRGRRAIVDRRGVTYRNQPVAEGANVRMDDDLVLHMEKCRSC